MLIMQRCRVAGFAGMSSEVATGLNIAKNGSDPPLKTDEELPDWLWKLAKPGRTLGDLRRGHELDYIDVSGGVVAFERMRV
jgi:hypothetical protein